MPKYSIETSKQADKFMEKAPNFITVRLEEAVDNLLLNPHEGIKMQGKYEYCRRIKVSNYRIIYEVLEDKRIIRIHEIESRGNTSYDR